MWVQSGWTLCHHTTLHTSSPATAVTHYTSNSKTEWQKAAENHALLGHYVASGGNFLPTFWDKLSVPSSGLKNLRILLDSWTPRIGPIGCPKTSVRNYRYSLHNKSEEHSSQLLRARSLKSGTEGRRQVAICIPSFTDLIVDSEKLLCSSFLIPTTPGNYWYCILFYQAPSPNGFVPHSQKQ